MSESSRLCFVSDPMLNLTSALRQHFRYPAFRLEQEEALTHVLAGRDALLVSPCYVAGEPLWNVVELERWY